MIVVVVVLILEELGDHLHHLSLSGYQLLHSIVVVVVVGVVATRRHLGF